MSNGNEAARVKENNRYAHRAKYLRNGKSYVEFSGKEDLDVQTLAAFDPEVFTISDSCPALETLLQQAVECESQAPDDPIEAFDETAMSSAPDLPATHNVNKK
ncbi:hypothetical protein E1B28_012277 [Marasmius oreades]|uniref:Uncharacterized protein n=1 Tax=Marasmius oreades TaxID=181124 RepID=A0A9P7UNI8_9AGAR|nr:uncharacterized protein E1B28_012277 [Marasmius oreades]KAG7088263.1 hypothetical protein E1B28_012277 [Marasmius oreades]